MQRSGEVEHDAAPVGQADLLADDVAERAFHLGERHFGAGVTVLGLQTERRRDVTLVYPEVEDADGHERAVAGGSDRRPGGPAEIILAECGQVGTVVTGVPMAQGYGPRSSPPMGTAGRGRGHHAAGSGHMSRRRPHWQPDCLAHFPAERYL